MPREVRIKLPAAVVDVATRQAHEAGIPLQRWATEVIEAWTAGLRCEHHRGPPAPPSTAEPDVEEP
jgi:hypothetical protein